MAFKIKLPKLPNPFDPEAVAARQENRTARVQARQGGKTTRASDRQDSRMELQPGRIANAMDRRERGVGAGQILMGLHGQANMSAEKFFGVQDGGQNQLFGMMGGMFGGGQGGGPLGGLGGMFGGGGGQAAGGAPAPGMPAWAVPVGIAALVGVGLLVATR